MIDGQCMWAAAMATILGGKLLPEHTTAERRADIAARIIEANSNINQAIPKEIFGENE